jgi:thiamine-phosphate pyrophosphorylase
VTDAFKLPLIYPITDKQLARSASHLLILKELVRGGAQLVQIRDKSTPIRELALDLHRCVEFALRKGIELVVNDRCDLALSCKADGVHLGQEDLPPEAARSIMGPKTILGLSTHSISQVRKSALMPIQYIGFGPVYPTSTKRDALPATGLQKLFQACSVSALPVVAIGGIDVERVHDVLQAGAASAAVVSGLMMEPNIAHAMQRFLEVARER